MKVFEEKAKPENPKKILSEKGRKCSSLYRFIQCTSQESKVLTVLEVPKGPSTANLKYKLIALHCVNYERVYSELFLQCYFVAPENQLDLRQINHKL